MEHEEGEHRKSLDGKLIIILGVVNSSLPFAKIKSIITTNEFILFPLHSDVTTSRLLLIQHVEGHRIGLIELTT